MARPSESRGESHAAPAQPCVLRLRAPPLARLGDRWDRPLRPHRACGRRPHPLGNGPGAGPVTPAAPRHCRSQSFISLCATLDRDSLSAAPSGRRATLGTVCGVRPQWGPRDAPHGVRAQPLRTAVAGGGPEAAEAFGGKTHRRHRRSLRCRAGRRAA